jgi:hypothetical protein
MTYKTELHAHTAEVSPCAGFKAADAVDKYIEAGFSTLVITDHFRYYVLDGAGITWRQKIDHFLAGYRHAKAHANGRLSVLFGIELQFVGEHNDYLIYGIDEDFLYGNPDIHKMALRSLRDILPPDAIIVHAHPFRNSCTIANPELIDGFEAYNGGTEDARNEFAGMWADRYGKIKTSGSDYHGGNASRINCGIETDEPITDARQLVQILKSQKYKLIQKRSPEK